MPLFYFVLKAGPHVYPDTNGQEFANETGARAHARTVARELMRNREARTSHWSIQVYNDYLEPGYECLFAEVDQRLEEYGRDLRISVTSVARNTAAVNDAIREIDGNLADLRQTLDRIGSITSSSSAANHH